MNIESILKEWDQDSQIDYDTLDQELIRIPKIHAKYYRYYVSEKVKLLSMKEDRKTMILDKNDYYRGIMTREELDRRGWEPWNLSILKAEIPMYLDADPHMKDLNLRIGVQQEKVDFLESIIKSLTNRGFNIKGAIDFMKFRAGG
jgi:hypothetical protein